VNAAIVKPFSHHLTSGIAQLVALKLMHPKKLFLSNHNGSGLHISHFAIVDDFVRCIALTPLFFTLVMQRKT
jgi:hypothetical protein